MATLTTYTVMVQNEANDYSTRAQNVIERGIKSVYQEILRHCARYIIGTTTETQTGSTSLRHVTPTDFMAVTDVQWRDAGDTNYTRLKPITEEDYLARSVNSATSRPTEWYVNGSKVYFNCIPDTAGTALITFLPVQDELEGANVSVIPDRFTGVLVLGATAWFKAYEGLPEAREYESQYIGPFGRQGRVEGALGGMLMELSIRQPVKKPKLFGR